MGAAGADIRPDIKNTEGKKGETITPKSNNTPCKCPQSNLKIRIMRAGRITLSIRGRKRGGRGKKAPDRRQKRRFMIGGKKTITVNR